VFILKKSNLIITTILLISLCLSTGLVSAQENLSSDVVVVGAGAAGLAASIEAANNGANVILLEKQAFVGGSTLLSGGIVYATESKLQKEMGVEDSVDALVDYWMSKAEGKADEDLLRLVAKKSGETIDWLMELGVEFNNPVPQGTSSVPRGHITNSRGFGLINPLKENAESLDVQIMTQTPAQELLTNNNGDVVGVKAVNQDGKTINISAKAVVLATGGFDQSEEMKKEYAPVAVDQMSFSGQGNVGDGLRMAKEVGAEIIAKNGVIGFRGVSEKFPYTTPLGGMIFIPGLFVDESGERFVNEASDYPLIYDEMIKTGSEKFYLILDQNGYAEPLEKGIEEGVVFKAESLESLGEQIGPKENFLNTVKEYNSFAENGKDEEFNKPASLLNPINEANFYALKIEPATLGSYGGPKISLNAEVLNKDGEPIKGLYAAGEVANGQFFYRIYPASGTSIQMSYTLGRIAGKNAAKLAK